MLAARIHDTDGPGAVKIEQIDVPSLAEGMLLVDVHAAGVSFPDLLLSKGEYQFKPEPPFTLGSEGAGVVREADPGSKFKPGDRVAFLTLGAFAETALVAEAMTFVLPDECSFETGAALIINYHTALFALRDRGRLAAGETVLVHGAAGGLGTASVQVAKALGARVLAVVSSDEKGATALQAGADEVIFGGDDWRDRARELTDGRGVEMIVDPVGGDRFKDSLRALAEGGRLLVVGFAAGSIPEVKVNRLLLRNIDLVGVAWGAYVATRPQLAREIGETVNGMLVDGLIDPPIQTVLPLTHVEDALRLLDERKARGKVVLRTR